MSSLRRAGDEFAVVILNFTPVPRPNYRIGVPEPGVYLEVFNSDSEYYGGSNTGNWELKAEEKEWMGRPYSIVLTLPPLAGIVLALKPEAKEVVPELTETAHETGETLSIAPQGEIEESGSESKA